MFRRKLVLIMKVRNFFILDCSQAERCCDKAQYNEAGFLEKIRLKIHIRFCKTCNKYTKKNTRLSALIKKASIKTCSKEEKEAYRKQIEQNT